MRLYRSYGGGFYHPMGLCYIVLVLRTSVVSGLHTGCHDVVISDIQLFLYCLGSGICGALLAYFGIKGTYVCDVV